MKEQEAIEIITRDIETQEQIKALAIANGNDTSDFDCQKRIYAYGLAVEALERRIQMEPAESESLLYDGFCPNCCNGLGIYDKFCSECGQRILWDFLENGGTEDD